MRPRKKRKKKLSSTESKQVVIIIYLVTMFYILLIVDICNNYLSVTLFTFRYLHCLQSKFYKSREIRNKFSQALRQVCN